MSEGHLTTPVRAAEASRRTRSRRVMFRVVGSVVVGLALLLAVGPAFAKDPFAMTVLDYPHSLTLGGSIEVIVELRNVSGQSLPTPIPWSDLRLEVLEAPQQARHFLWADNRFDHPSPVAIAKAPVLSADWRLVTVRHLVPPIVGEYKVRMVLQIHDGRGAPTGEPPNHWVGQVETEPLAVSVTAPTGIDAEAFRTIVAMESTDPYRSPAQKFWPTVAVTPGAIKLLMTKYPTSTFAALKVYARYHARDARWTVGAILNNLDYAARFDLKSSTLCNEKGDRDAEHPTKLKGHEFFACRKSWLQFVLEHHPNIWFADEVRFRIALDDYLLGDTDGCEAGLEDLAEHGKPWVASKAGELLAAMRAKGMLEPKPPPAPGR